MTKIVVFPASGWQGRSVCDALANDSRYEVVGVARNLESPKLSGGEIDVRSLNVNLVKGDFADPDSYRQHLHSAYGVFINTDFWTLYGECGGDKTKALALEVEYVKNIFDECKKAEVKHVVFSSLFRATKIDLDYISNEQKLNDVLRSSGIPYTIYYSTGYWENLERYNMIKSQPDGSVSVNLMCPDATSQLFTSVKWVGAFVKKIFDEPDKYIGKEVLNSSEWASWGSIATRLAEMSGKSVTTPNISDATWNSDAMKAPMGELWSVFNALYTSGYSVDFPGMTGREVVKDLPNFDEWARSNQYMKGIFGI